MTVTRPIRTRFAPSPTGRLHLGHARAALEAFGFAAQRDGTCLLRIEDIDHTRCRPDYTRGIYEDLDWLGLDWPLPVRVQSAHFAEYANIASRLIARGLAYPCTLTRGDLSAGQFCGPDTPLDFEDGEIEKWPDNRLSDLQAETATSDRRRESVTDILTRCAERPKPALPFAVRLDLAACLKAVGDHPLPFVETGDPAGERVVEGRISLHDWAVSDRSDPVIARRDIGTSYHIAVIHDDALQGITHIVRGRDLFDETPLHVLLQTLMDWPVPTYHHHALVLREDGEKLAKRNLDTSLFSLREAGQSVEAVKHLAGLS